MNLDAIIREMGAVAHDVPLWTGPHTAPRAIDVATDEDWWECCVRAVIRMSIGAGRVEDGWTWEEAIARWATWYLRLGAGEPAMGRTPDEAVWAEQCVRWTEIVFFIATGGSAHHDVRRGDDGTIVETPSGTVLTARGRVHVSELPRATHTTT